MVGVVIVVPGREPGERNVHETWSSALHGSRLKNLRGWLWPRSRRRHDSLQEDKTVENVGEVHNCGGDGVEVDQVCSSDGK